MAAAVLSRHLIRKHAVCSALSAVFVRRSEALAVRLVDTASTSRVKHLELAAFALEVTIGVSASSPLARIVLALVDIFTDSLLRIVFVALVTGASVRAWCVLALAVDARIVK